MYQIVEKVACFREHVEHVIVKASNNIEQRLLVILYQVLVLSAIEYAVAILIICKT
uniref:Uncharacterized protein n=1 Tax=Arion vulgaris TaxID=1028688 RepID=A0A0B7BXV7_9EUPU